MLAKTHKNSLLVYRHHLRNHFFKIHQLIMQNNIEAEGKLQNYALSQISCGDV